MSNKVKITGPITCRIVAEITKNPEHVGECPIIMDKEKWLLIKPLVEYKKQNPPKYNIGSMFKDFFKEPVFKKFEND